MNRILCARALLIVAVVGSGRAAAQLTAFERDQILDAHNTARAGVLPGALPYVAALTWDATVAAAAQARADTCPTSNGSTTYGQNFAHSVATAPAATALWLSEGQFYDYPTDSREIGESCSHFTQAIWAETTLLGCGKRTGCPVFTPVWVCYYSPAGNVTGEWPYLCGSGLDAAPCDADNLFIHGFEQGNTLGWS